MKTDNAKNNHKTMLYDCIGTTSNPMYDKVQYIKSRTST